MAAILQHTSLAVIVEYFADINSMRYINLKKPWRNTRTLNDLSVSGKVFSVIGAMNTWINCHMNAESYYGDAMAYYDVVLKRKAMRDEDFIRILEIIRSIRTINFGYAFGCFRSCRRR